MKYRVTQQSFIGGRVVAAGEILDLPDGLKDSHFEPLSAAEVRRTVEALNKPKAPVPPIIPAPVKAKAPPVPIPAVQYPEKKK